MALDEAIAVAATGDVWLFRGASVADFAIRTVTNAPVNHVGMVVALDDLPPLLWHAELGRSLPDVWTGEHQRGVQLHKLADAVTTWKHRYGQRGWVRQLEGTIEREHEDRLMEVIQQHDGRAFPTTLGLAGQWAKGRVRRARSSRWRRSTAPSWWPPPTRPWGCCPPSARPAGTTRGASGAATASSSCRPSRSAARSPSRCPTRPRTSAEPAPEATAQVESSDARSMPRLRLPGRRRRRRPDRGRGARSRPDAPRARPWLRPPALRMPADGEGDERHASWLELFFDLVFVVAVAELAQELARDHSLGGFAIFAGLFLPVFIAWQGFTFYADRFDSDDVLFRVVMLAAMLAIAALAVQIPDVAAGRHDAGFVVAYVTLRSLLVALYLRAWPHAAAARPLIARYAGGYSLSIALWLGSLLVDPPVRYVLWGVGLAIEYAMPVARPAHPRADPGRPQPTCPSASRSSRSSSWASRSWPWRSGPRTRTGAWPRRDRGARLRGGRLPVVGVLRPRHGGRPQQPRPVDADLHAHPHPAAGGAHRRRCRRAHAHPGGSDGRGAGRGRVGARRRRGALPAVPHHRPARHRTRAGARAARALAGIALVVLAAPAGASRPSASSPARRPRSSRS